MGKIESVLLPSKEEKAPISFREEGSNFLTLSKFEKIKIKALVWCSCWWSNKRKSLMTCHSNWSFSWRNSRMLPWMSYLVVTSFKRYLTPNQLDS